MREDTFNGDDAKLVRSIDALLSLDASGSLVPHGVGGHARALLTSAAARLIARAEGRPSPEGEEVASIVRELQHIRIGMLDQYQASIILERLVGRAQKAALSTPSPERAEGATAGEVKGNLPADPASVLPVLAHLVATGEATAKQRAELAAALSQPSQDIEALKREAYQQGWNDREGDLIAGAERVLGPSQVGKEEARELRLGGVDHEAARRVNLADLGYRGGVSDEAREEIARAELRAGLVLSTAEQYVFKGASLQERPDYPPPCPSKGLDEDDVAHLYDAAWAEIEGEASNWCSVRKVRLRRLIDAYAALSSPPAPAAEPVAVSREELEQEISEAVLSASVEVPDDFGDRVAMRRTITKNTADAILQRLSNQQGEGKGSIPELPGVSAVQQPASSTAQHFSGEANLSDGSGA